MNKIIKDRQYAKFCAYGFFKNLRFFEAFILLFFLNQGLTFLQIGTLYAIREIMINIFEIPSGLLADTAGRRKTLASSFVVYIISFVLFYAGSSYFTFTLAMVCYALGDAVRSGVHKALIFEYLAQTNQTRLKVAYYGHTRSWSQLGSAVSSLAAGALVFLTDQMELVFLFSIIPYAIDFINVLSYPASLDHFKLVPSVNWNERIRFVFKTFLQSFKTGYTIRALMNSSLYSGYYKSIKDYIQPLLGSLVLQVPLMYSITKHQQLALLIGVVYFIIFSMNSIASRHAHSMNKLFGSPEQTLNLTLLIGAILGIITGVGMMSELGYGLVFLFVILLVIENLRKPSGVAVVTESTDPSVHAGILSASSQLSSGFTAIFAIVIGFVADHFSIGAGIGTISLFLVVALPFIKVKP